MKATGIVRRIDELGRVVIPKEIRRTQRIRQGDALEIYTAPDGEVIFKKYSPVMDLGEITGIYADVLAKNLGAPVLVCDRDVVVAAAGAARGEKEDLMGRPITRELEKLLAARSVYTAPADPSRQVRAVSGSGERVLGCAAPILVGGDIEGGVCVLSSAQGEPPGELQTGAVRIAANFLARWMEE
ncbi:stage V sporulation T C-terminal domain-containing protein [uncultured Gemmiger sp.]|uniref:stage V sporulation T C-terminal domain-containing protein n=1 Tax=uncultured Gemmiger sp. TaxID=1623490 RepID=UPI0025DCC250|nr:stage V sporulation T C-terminal domain-containing protein [uncultured Gemmiger sp.]